ncbi:uncharacterized protein LOC121430125 [Lytechinus variegatus]|uniref:uncharacterized protein LOC121430125 n=1 Tax=Lytechinus variegatus TaxID=7654 RepID=UPI001BB1579C|nr:uncharacterized protein LOC121430125 [Lytechinus variegatus]
MEANVRQVLDWLEDDGLQEWMRSESGTSSSYNTVKQIRYAVSLLKQFSKRVNKKLDDDIDTKSLDVLLSNFYKGARSKKGGFYSTKSMNAIRYGLQRHFLKTRGVNIMKREEFPSSNSIYKAVIRKIRRVHGDKESRQYSQITPEDMGRIQAILDLKTPQGLQWKVFLDTVLYFGRSSMKILRLARHSEFVLHREDNKLYYTFRDDDVKMHAMPGNPRCPVLNLNKYISKLHVDCPFLWQRPKIQTIPQACQGDQLQDQSPWYSTSPLGKNTLNSFMRTISAAASCKKIYTTHSLRISLTDEILEVLSGSSNINEGNAITVITLPTPASSGDSIVAEVKTATTTRPKLPISATTSTTALKGPLVNIVQTPRPSLTSSSSNLATNPIQQDNRKTLKSNTNIEKGTMTDLSWTEVPKFLVQSADASTQCKKLITLKTRNASTATTLSTPTAQLQQQAIDRFDHNSPSHSKDTSVIQVDEPMDQCESTEDMNIHHVSTAEARPKHSVTEASKERDQTNSSVMNKILQEVIDKESEGSDYQTFYIKQEPPDDQDGDDDITAVQRSSACTPPMDPTSWRSAQQSSSPRAPIQNRGQHAKSNKIYKLKFHVTQGITKVVYAIDSPNEIVKGATLKKAICSKIQHPMNSLLLQYYDGCWQEWIDVEPSMALRGGTRLRVTQKSRSGAELRHQILNASGRNKHTLKYHVTLENSKQLLTMGSSEDTVSGAAIKEAVCSMLHNMREEVLIQYFDNDWQEWINVGSSTMLKGRMYLKILQASRSSPFNSYALSIL